MRGVALALNQHHTLGARCTCGETMPETRLDTPVWWSEHLGAVVEKFYADMKAMSNSTPIRNLQRLLHIGDMPVWEPSATDRSWFAGHPLRAGEDCLDEAQVRMVLAWLESFERMTWAKASAIARGEEPDPLTVAQARAAAARTPHQHEGDRFQCEVVGCGKQDMDPIHAIHECQVRPFEVDGCARHTGPRCV